MEILKYVQGIIREKTSFFFGGALAGIFTSWPFLFIKFNFLLGITDFVFQSAARLLAVGAIGFTTGMFTVLGRRFGRMIDAKYQKFKNKHFKK